MRIEAFLAATMAAMVAVLPAQDRQQPAGAPRSLAVDEVIATVNDSAILLSTVRSSAVGRINSIEAEIGQRLPYREMLIVLKNYLEEEINRTSLAQAAMSFGVASPEQIEKALKDELDRDEAAQVRDFGTYLEYSRELQKQGRIWPTYQRQKRIDKLYEFAKSFAIGMRMQKQGNLYLTPRMLRETYRRNLDQFVHGATAELALVLFAGPKAEEHARAASTIWALERLSPRELVERLPDARGTPMRDNLRGITEASRQSIDDALVDFALQGPVDRVSTPIPAQGGYLVARIVNFAPAAAGKFEDAEVQARLREICEKSVVQEFYKQALERAADRTEVWRSSEFR